MKVPKATKQNGMQDYFVAATATQLSLANNRYITASRTALHKEVVM